MANYSSYKKISGDQIEAGVLGAAKFSQSPTGTYGVKWFYGSPQPCTSGCCCLWTIPTGVNRLWIQAWGAGGNGHGMCNCDRCQHYMGAGGGSYNSVMVQTAPGCQYSVCAGGVYPCYSRECNGCVGCSSYVTGYNLSNFCAVGGCSGQANGSWQESCSSVNTCCTGPGNNGGDFGFNNHVGTWSNTRHDTYRGWCHCYNQGTSPSSAPLIGTSVGTYIRSCWVRCGCWQVPYGHGGQGAMGTECGSGCCGQGGTGGGGLVKITYF